MDTLATATETGASGIGASAPRAGYRILLVGPTPPPYGGMALQARQLETRLVEDGNVVAFLASNFAFPAGWGAFERVPVVRTLFRAAAIWVLLWRRMNAVEVVHVLAASWWYFFLAVCPAVTVARARGKRVVVNYRGGEAAEFFQTWGWLAGPVLRAAHVVTAPSEFLAGVIGKRFGIAVTIVPNILDTQRFRYRARPSIQPRMVVTRHLEEIYDVESVLRAFHLVKERHPAATLAIAGTGSQGERLKRLAIEWGLTDVTFLGHVPHERLAALYDECDILLNASRVDNFPGALVEASASGLVVVSTGAGGIPHIYRDGVSALLMAPGDWRGLADGVERVLADPALAASLSREGADVARQCEWTRVREALYRVYGPEGRATCAAG